MNKKLSLSVFLTLPLFLIGCGTQATSVVGRSMAPDWSPDGTRIVYNVQENETHTSVWVMNADGSDKHNLTASHQGFDAEPAWSPDGSQIAFMSNRSGHGADIWVMNTDGSNPVNLTNEEFIAIAPVWSPDGQYIAFHTLPTEVFDASDLWIVSRDGSDKRNFTPARSLNAYHWPHWSPDSSEIAVVSTDKAAQVLWVYDLEGERTGYHPRATGLGLDWSADGRRFAVTAIDSETINLLIFDVGSNHPANIIPEGLALSGPVEWGPDNVTLAFVASDPDAGAGTDIWLINADGSGLTNLTQDPDYNDLEPVWSPDGTRIAFQSDRDGREDIWVINVDGTGLTNLTGMDNQ